MADETEIAKAMINSLAGIVSRDSTVGIQAAEVDGVITVTLTVRAPQVHYYPHLAEVRLNAGDSITLRVEGVEAAGAA